MLIAVDGKDKCSKCGSNKVPDIKWKGNDGYIVCTVCGHEALYATLTTTKHDGPPVSIYLDNPIREY
jgi:transcription elongation factor Elf1